MTEQDQLTHYQPIINAMAGAMSKRFNNKVERDDLVQVGMLSALLAIRSCSVGEANLLGAYQIAGRVKFDMLDYCRGWLHYRNPVEFISYSQKRLAGSLEPAVDNVRAVEAGIDVEQLITRLNERRRGVIGARLAGLNQAEIAQHLEVIPARVSQIEAAAVKVMRKAVGR